MRDLSEVQLDYRLEEHLPLDLPAAHHHVERWTVSVFVAETAAENGRVEIGYAKLMVFNLGPGADIRDLTDRESGTWVDANDDEGQPESHVLLLDRLWLHPDWRGQGLGPIVAAAAIERLGRGCHLAACYPAPFEDPTQQPDDRQRAIEALGQVWSKVGFTQWNDGVWMLDLDTSDVHRTLVGLLSDRRYSSA